MDAAKPRMVGINHVAIQVGDIDAALAFYGEIFQYTLRGRGEHNAFIDLGDQFIALMQGPASGKLEQRHFGIVVDDRSSVRARAEAAGATVLDGRFLDFLDPWGNRIEVVEYANVQFSQAPHVLRGMGLALSKNDKARGELAEKGMEEG
ncbi:MAG TPA: VOC family protein [Acetobacteraceae bacterium]|nr:VOC family protein [Acetobacteraceae bacterium]